MTKLTEKKLPFINYPHLHRQVRAKEYFKAQASHELTKFKGDYTMIPRGRVIWSANGLNRFWTSSLVVLKMNSIFPALNLFMMNIGIWTTGGAVI